MVTVYERLLPNPKEPSHKAQIYLAFKANGGRLTTEKMVQYPPQGLGIAEYTGRLTDLRKLGFVISNTELNHYQLISEPEPTVNDLKLLYVACKELGYKQLLPRIDEKAETLKQLEAVKESLF